MNYVMIPYKWKQFIYHVDRARDQYSIAEAGLVVGGKEREEGRQTMFFTPLDPFNIDASGAELITDIKKPRKVHCQIHWRPEQDAVYWIHLSTAQDACLEFWQTGSNAIITCQSVPKECVVKVVSESGKRELFAWQLTPRERPKVTLRDTWGHTGSNVLHRPRETESKLQMWDTDTISSESRNWPNEECEQSVDLRVKGIANDEIYEDEHYMQRIAEQVQKLVNTERIFEKKTHLGTTSWVKRPRRKCMKQAIANCMKFSEGLTKYNVSVVILTWKLDSKYVHADES